MHKLSITPPYARTVGEINEQNDEVYDAHITLVRKSENYDILMDKLENA